jgi:hypothetical protein
MRPNFLQLCCAAAALSLLGCAHTQPDEMTASEHRSEAARHQQVAENQRKDATRDEVFYGNGPRSPFSDEAPTLRPYHPTAARLDAADRQMQDAFTHLQAAQQLEKFEAAACEGMSEAERRSCPLLAPHAQWVEEVGPGLLLHLKPGAPAQRLSAQLRCHLAFAQARGFDRAPCPLFVKGVEITSDGSTLAFKSMNPKVAAQVRTEGRKMFGEPTSEPPQ